MGAKRHLDGVSGKGTATRICADGAKTIPMRRMAEIGWPRVQTKSPPRRKRRSGPCRGAESFLPGYTRAACSASSTRLALSGARRIRTPVASKMALATAAPVGLHAASPAP